jgi:cystathionine gamma-lyase
MKFGTKALHAGIVPDPTTGAIMTPIFQTTTYVQDFPGQHKGYAYSRGKNPTRTQLENNLAALEDAKHAVAFSSGMGAVDAVIKLLKPGDEIITGDDIYGGSYRMFSKIYEPMGIKFHYINLYDATNIEQHINSNTKLIWVETPTNPTLKIVDIKAVSEVAKKHNLIYCVDNTFASPYLQNPLALGADIVMHSATKYLGGHSDVVMGALMTNDTALYERLAFILNSCGANPGPFDCFLMLRGIKTLHLRIKAHCENGRAIAHYLREHPKVGKVYWPGFEDAAGHEIAKKQMRDFGGMVSFTLKGDNFDSAMKFATSVKIIALAESLGGVESLVNHPASMTHASIPKEEREKAGVVDGLLRLSVGVEDIEDLIADVEQALAQV